MTAAARTGSRGSHDLTGVELVDQIADNLAEYDLEKFTVTSSGRRFGEPYAFKKSAPTDLVKRQRDWQGKGHVGMLTNPQANYLSQLVAKEYKAPIEVRSVDTAMEVHNVAKDTFVGRNYWEQHREIFYRVGDSKWAIAHPKVIPVEGKLVYAINGSVKNISKIVNGKMSVEASEETIDGGVKVDGDMFDALRQAKILRDHKGVEVNGGGIHFEDDNYLNTASVGSGSYWADGLFDADAIRPSGGRDRGLAVPELIEA